METKSCASCGQVLPISEFYLRSDTGRYRSHCKKCHGTRSYATRDKFNHRKISYKSQLKANYDLTVEDFQNMFETQQRKCGICEVQLENIFEGIEGVRPAVDHCHNTLKIRGLLCTECNSAIGKLRDNPDLLRKGIEWLEK